MSTPLDVQLCAPARGAIAVITRMQFIPHECFELGVDSSARATRLPMAAVFREAGPSAIQKKGKCGMGIRRRRRLRFLTRLHAVERLAVTRATAGMGVQLHDPPSSATIST
jgi:hypothetical protein